MAIQSSLHLCVRAALIGAVACSALVLAAACSDTTDPGDQDGRADAGAGVDGRVPPVDVSLPDSSSPSGDAGNPADASAKITTTLGSTGQIFLSPTRFTATTFVDDTIVTASDAPECVAIVRTRTKRTSPAGAFVIAGENFGQDGGPPTALTVTPSLVTEGRYSISTSPMFLWVQGSSQRVVLDKSDFATAPAFPAPVTLHAPPLLGATITAPAIPSDGDGGTLPIVVKSTQNLEVAWTIPVTDGGAPDASAASQQMIVGFFGFGAGTTKVADLNCAYPFGSGRATIPASILGALKEHLGSTEPVQFFLRVTAGEQKVLSPTGAVYVIILQDIRSTSFSDPIAELQ